MTSIFQRDEAVKVFEHFASLGVKPNAKTYSLLVDAHLIKRDAKAALLMIKDMVIHPLYGCSFYIFIQFIKHFRANTYVMSR